MSDLSDLDLVAQAMAPTDKPSVSKPTNNDQDDQAPKSKSEPKGQSSSMPDSNIDIDNLDLSSLTPEDLALLQPLLSALSMSDSDTDLLDENALADVFKQMNAAGEVADDLEGKLDRLIGELGKVEEGILEGMDDKTKIKSRDTDGEKGEGKGGDGVGKVDKSELTADEKK